MNLAVLATVGAIWGVGSACPNCTTSMAHPTGAAIGSISGHGRVITVHAPGSYLIVPGVGALPMEAGRCSFTTTWSGVPYADQDFPDGLGGGGPPLPGSAPCRRAPR